MNQLMEWFAMGGYSLYVWPAYGVVCVVLVMHVLGIKWQRLQTTKKIKAWFKRQE